MIVAGSASPLLLSSGGYNLTNSLRFRASASAYLNRTFTTPTDTKKFTWSGWVKRGNIGGATNYIFSATPDSYTTFVNFGFVNGSAGSVDYLTFDQYSGGYQVRATTNAIYRDPSAWYHIVLVWDSANATSTDRTQIWVNGVRATVTYHFGPISQNASSILNANGSVNYISRLTSNYFDGYLAEVNFIDGQALTPSSFGQTSSTTGVWQPIRYTGTYGTNGFYLDFEDTSSVAALGYDAAGSNDWTVNNISLTSGSTYDSMKDVPTLTDTDTANYWTLNPLNSGQLGTPQSGNLEWIAGDQNNFRTIAAPILPSSGKFYWEVQPIGGGAGGAFVSGIYIGIMNYANGGTGLFASGARIADTGKDDFVYYSDGRKVNLNSFVSYGTAYVANDIIGIAVDIDNGKIWFSKNGTWQASGDPAAGTNAAYTTVPFSTKPYAPAMSAAEITNAQKYNFGQRPFAYTPPSGFKALNTYNLPTPTIGATASSQSANYFASTLYTGTGSNITIANTVNGISFQPDFVWTKSRSAATNNILINAVTGGANYLVSDSTSAESNAPSAAIQSFNSTGYVMGTGGAVNTNGATYVAWQWKANGSGSTNTAGSITSTVSANTTAGFSIVTFNAGTAGNKTVGHGLGVKPAMVIFKDRTTTSSWLVWHQSLSSQTQSYLILQTTAASVNDSRIWANTAPTSTVLSFESGYSFDINDNVVAYCFAEVAGYSAFGSYTGNGSSDGPFVFTGFRPRFILIKESTPNARGWRIFDTVRNPYNQTGLSLSPNSSDAEDNGSNLYNQMDILSNGFKLRAGTNSEPTNESGATYIYACFAESPFKYANAR